MQCMHPSTNITMSNVRNSPADRPIDRMTKPPSRLSAIPPQKSLMPHALHTCAVCGSISSSIWTTIAAHNNHKLETLHQSIYITWNNRICTETHSLYRMAIGWASTRALTNARRKRNDRIVSAAAVPIIEFDFIYWIQYYSGVAFARSNNELLFRYKIAIKFIFVASKQRIE